MPEGFHPPVEEYLATMYELGEEGTPVIRARLAERLGHSAPSVTEMVRRLIDDGYVEVSQRSLHLTDTGQKLAESVVRKHRLAERLLTDVIGLEWHKTHREAGRWEHVISDEVEERLVTVLGSPKTCPHGNPIPGMPQPRRKLRALAEVEPGTRITLERVSESVELDLETLTYLDENGLRPGVSAEVMTRAPDGTVMVGVDGGTLAIGSGLAENLYAATA